MADKSETNSAIQKAIAILEAVGSDLRPLAIPDIAAELDLPRQTVHRVVRQLEEIDLLVRDPSRERYTIGPRFRRLAISAISTWQQTGVTHAILQRLVDEVGETCNIGMLDGNEVIYVDRCECDWPLRVQLKAGSHVPVHCTAIGKLLLAYQDGETRRRVISTAGLARYTKNTITDPKALDSALDEICSQGYSINDQEDAVGLIALAVPVFDPQAEVIAGLAVHAPEARLSIADAKKLLPRFQAAAAEISAAWFHDEKPDAVRATGD